MPGGDRTGPKGLGSMTGWGRGFCGRVGSRGGFIGGRSGGGFGGGRGLRNRFRFSTEPRWLSATDSDDFPAGETERLRTERDDLRAALGEMDRRLEALEKHVRGG